jgi:hypothetical protein
MACNEDLALANEVRRSCINTRRRENIVIHANTAKTSSEKNEYFLKDVFACFLQGVNIKSTCKDYTKSRKQQQGHLHCFSASTFPVISSTEFSASFSGTKLLILPGHII